MGKRVFIYVRVSTQEQAREGYSIDEQTKRLKKYCEAMGWTVVMVYTDAGYSGADTNRPALQRMIRDVKAGKGDAVAVYKLDRLSRSQKDTLELIEDIFLENDTDFVSMTENFDTSTPFGRAMVGILAVFAQLEREQIKERMSMGKEARAKLGKYHGSCQVPIGYDYVDGELVTNEFEKMQVQQIFKWYASGIAPYTIAKRLNESGQTHDNRNWSDQVIRTLLTKKTYLGYISHKNEWYKGTHEAYITQELFDKVQMVMKQKSEEHQKYNRRLGRANTYLGGYLHCGKCKAKVHKVLSGEKTPEKDYRKPFYVCYSRSKRSKHMVKDPNCKNKRWHMAELDSLVLDEIRKLALDPDYYNQIQESQPEDERPKIIKKEIGKLDSQLANLMDLYSVGQMPMEILQGKIQGLNDKKMKLEDELEAIRKEQEAKLTRDETVRLVQSFGDILDRGDIDEIRTVIGTLIKDIEINDELIDIHWTFA